MSWQSPSNPEIKFHPLPTTFHSWFTRMIGILILLLPVSSLVALTIEMDPKRIPASGVTYTLHSTSGDRAPHDGVFPPDGHLHLPLPSTSLWRLSARGEGLWFEPRLITGNDSIFLDPYALSPYRAKVRHESDLNPDTAYFTLTTAAAVSSKQENPDTVSLEVSCSILKGLIDCGLPEGQWDMAVRVDGFRTIRRWNYSLTPEKTVTDRLLLKEGSTLSGRFALAAGELDPKKLKIEVRPFILGADSVRDHQEKKKMAEVATANPWGYFQLDGLQDGIYVLSAEYPGFAPRTVKPISIDAGRETVLEPTIVLEYPVSLQVRVYPPNDPQGVTWSVALLKEGLNPSHWETARHPTPLSAGTLMFRDLESGGYYLELLDGASQIMKRERVELGSEDKIVNLEIGTVAVKGLLTLGDEPLSGTLSFDHLESGAHGVTMLADEEGNFSGQLPQEGDWNVEVRGDDPKLRRSGIKVEVAPVENTAQISIALANTLLEGQVVDEWGNAAVPASVSVIHLGEERTVEFAPTDKEGEFQLRGLPPGLYTVSAEKKEARSRLEEVEIEEDEPLYLKIVLRVDSVISGQVLTPLGSGVPGVHLDAFPERAGTLNASTTPQAITDSEGRWEMNLPRDTDALTLYVYAPGWPFQALKVPIQDDYEIQLQEGQGELLIHIPDSESFLSTAILKDDVLIHLGLLMKWFLMHQKEFVEGKALRIPAMPLGNYAICQLDISTIEGILNPRNWDCGGASFLGPGGELTFTAP